MRVVPGLHARVSRPALVVHRVAALEDHAVDRARPAQHLATRVVDLAPAHVGLGLRLIPPVIETVADGERQGGGHVDVDVPQRVVAPCLQHQHPRPRVRAEAVGKTAAGRAPTDDHVVVAHVRSLPLSHRTARISRSNISMCSAMIARAPSASPSAIARSRSPCSCTRANRCGNLSSTRYQIRNDRLKKRPSELLQIRVARAAMDEPVHTGVERHQGRDVVAALAVGPARAAAPPARPAGRG